MLFSPVGGFAVHTEIPGTGQILNLRIKWLIVAFQGGARMLLRALVKTGAPFLPTGGPVSCGATEPPR